jgi:hypothetical protein
MKKLRVIERNTLQYQKTHKPTEPIKIPPQKKKRTWVRKKFKPTFQPGGVFLQTGLTLFEGPQP